MLQMWSVCRPFLSAPVVTVCCFLILWQWSMPSAKKMMDRFSLVPVAVGRARRSCLPFRFHRFKSTKLICGTHNQANGKQRQLVVFMSVICYRCSNVNSTYFWHIEFVALLCLEHWRLLLLWLFVYLGRVLSLFVSFCFATWTMQLRSTYI